MVQSYLEDSSVAEAGALGRFGGMLSGFARGMATIGAIGAWFGGSAGMTAFLDGLKEGGVSAAFSAIGGSSAPALISGISGVMGAIAFAGGAMQAVESFRSGKNKKGIKQLIVGAAEGLFIGAAVLSAATAQFAFGWGLVILPVLEIASKLGTGKTMTAHFGNAVGSVLDAVMGTKEFGHKKQQQVNVMQAQGMGMQQQMGMAPQMMMPEPTYGQMMAPNGMAYSAVPAGVGAAQMMQQPQQTYWQDYVAPQRGAQAQEPVMLSGAEAGRYTQAVDNAREAAIMNPDLTNRQ